MGFFKALTIIDAVIGLVIVLVTLRAPGAAQQAGGAAIAIFLVIAPYCIHGVLFRSHIASQTMRLTAPPGNENENSHYYD